MLGFADHRFTRGYNPAPLRGDVNIKMKPKFRKLGLVLLLGAIINIAVAWALVLTIEFRSLDSARFLEDSPPQIVLVEAFGSEYACITLGVTRLALGLEDLPIQTHSRFDSPSDCLVPTDGYSRPGIESRGWPFLSMCWQHDGLRPPKLRHGIKLGSDADVVTLSDPEGSRRLTMHRRVGTRILPICPLWPGFAINTVFYATILWLLFTAPGRIRRTIRRRRGLCPKCAYDLRGCASSSICPECGNPVNVKGVESP